ncbi:MAG: hypothetical protein GY714_06705 [Desulfobacterales bacterium]|nr:hypothetical protein [Desulfobacterales bacterium]MCP4159965.1 hypothetical protein [Deltaproteobacteria bacterium]
MSEKVFSEKDLNTLKNEAFKELYNRSRSSSLAYFLIFLVLALTTGYVQKHTKAVIVVGIIILFLTIVRMAAALTAPNKYDLNPTRWKLQIRALTLISGLGWGGFTVLTIHLNTISSPISVFNLILTCGLVAGGTTSLAPIGSLMRYFIVIMILPILIYTAIIGEYSYSLLFVIYIILMSVIGKAAFTSYWENIKNNLLIKKQEDKILKSVEEITTNSGYLENSSKSLSDISGEMYDISSNMSTKSDNVASSAEKMSMNINSVSSATEQTSSNMGIIASAVEEMSISIKEISQRAGAALNVSGDGVKSVQSANEKMEQLTTVANEIGNMTGIISDISEQTNLLALNATIEAARAGEAGKGFAVVANEIKDLANQTSNATSKIKEQVTNIQQSVSESINKIDEFSNIVGSINQTISEVAASVEEQSVTSNEISIKAEEISSAVNDISANMSESADVTKEIAQDISGISTLAEDLSGKSVFIKDSSGEILGNSNKLITLAEKMSDKKQ